ncbi:acidic endochitinase-like [Trifolium medium]|uniref:Acidic endochitinase-like n=1 Tax=Trifolium medium TaxID=97028 RepID=A0A392LYQ1_9FABA|nr:acidic endochitinase-like [Trifolium medium]
MPDHYLDKAIKTGLFDYVLVQFYNNPPCQYNLANGDATLLLQSWNAWTSLVLPNNTVFMGLPTSPSAAPSGGYIPPNDVITKVLPHIKKTSNYGGIMLWDRFNDVGNNYSNQIKGKPKIKSLRLGHGRAKECHGRESVWKHHHGRASASHGHGSPC